MTRSEFTDAFDYITQTIRYYYDSGTVELMRVTLGILAALLDRLGHHEPAATISGFAVRRLARASFPEDRSTQPRPSARGLPGGPMATAN